MNDRGSLKIKNILKPIAFVVIFIMLFVSVSYIMRGPGEKEKNEDRKAAFAGFYAEPKDSLDVVIIGGSAVFPFYAMPYMWHEFGWTGYTMSSPVQKVENFKYLIEEAKDRQNPQLFIFEVRMFTYDYSEITQEEWDFFQRVITDNMKYSTNRSNLIEAAISEPDVADYIDLIRYHSNWKNIGLSDLKYWDFSVHDSNKGAYFRSDIKEVEIPTWSEITQEEPIADFQEENLRELLDYLDEEKIQALFIVSPNNIDEKTAKQYNYIKRIIEERSYGFLNMIENFEDLDLDVKTDFYNRLHVNINGQQKVMDYLGNYIKNNYVLNVSHSEDIVSAWNQDYEEWKETRDSYIIEWEKNKEALNG